MSIEQDIAGLRADLVALHHELERITQTVERRSYKISEAAEALGVSERQLYKIVAAGGLIAVTLPSMTEKRIPAWSLDAAVGAPGAGPPELAPST